MFLLIPTQLHSQVGLQGIRSRTKPSRSGVELTVNREQRMQNTLSLSNTTKSSGLVQPGGNRIETVTETSENKHSVDYSKLSQVDKAMPPLKRKDTEKISRHMDTNKPMYDHSETGFLWSWNFTVSKRWKQSSNTAATGDIPFMDKMLADFRDFCSNKDDRLKKFWDESWSKKEAYEEPLNSEK